LPHLKLWIKPEVFLGLFVVDNFTSQRKKIVIVSGSRSESGLLLPLIDELRNYFLVRVVAIGSHLSEQFGHTIDNVPFDYSFHTLLDCDGPVGVSKSIALTILSLADKWDVRYDRPDCIVVLGDRSETFAASIAAYNTGIKIAHIEGDDITLGSLDEGYRKSIRSMASIRFDVAEYGSLGCVFPPLLEKRIFSSGIVLVYHPYKGDWESEIDVLIDYFCLNKDVVAIAPNSDAGGRKILDKYGKADITCIKNLDRQSYISLLKKAKFIIGNSSSGIIEAPSLGVPSINVGHRQDGRKRAESVIDCEGTTDGIREAIEKTKQIKWGFVNPYAKANTVEQIVQALKKELDRV
jgi:UDP-N-acetylglucosamine 2-epimerase